LLEQIVRETLPRDATEPMRRAQADAAPELATVSARIPSLVVVVAGATAGAQIRIDHREVASGVSIDLDPGEHGIEATSEEAAPVVRILTLAESSGRSTITLSLVAKGRDARRGSRTPAWIALGVGATGTVVGAVTGIVALTTASSVKDSCVESHCFPADRASADRAKLLGTTSTIAFAAAGVAVATGLALWWIRPGGEQTAITAGPDRVTISGTF
jgi:hypothetical protein